MIITIRFDEMNTVKPMLAATSGKGHPVNKCHSRKTVIGNLKQTDPE